MSIQKKYIALILFIVLSIGFGMGQSTVKEPKERVVTKEVNKSDRQWRELKDVDDRGFLIAGDLIEQCKNGFYAVAENDSAGLNKALTEVNDKLNPRLEAFAEDRAQVLNKLGYKAE